jgi:hypothetical protein
MSTAKKVTTDTTLDFDPEAVAWKPGRHAGKTLTVPLSVLRSMAAKTQVQVSEASELAQSEVSKIERRDLDGMQVSTLRRYVEGLGAKLELVAVVGGRRVVIASPKE